MAERNLANLASQLQLAERLQHLIYLSSSLIVVSGKKGAGKSIAIENLSNLLPESTIENILSLNTTLNESEARSKILSRLFSKPLFNPEEHLLTSILQLQRNDIVDVSHLLIFDNAQLLPDRMIVEFAEIIKNKNEIIEGEFNILFCCEEGYAHKLTTLLSGVFYAVNFSYQEFSVPPLSNVEVQQLFRHESQKFEHLTKIKLSTEHASLLIACNGNPLEIIKLVHMFYSLKNDEEGLTVNKRLNPKKRKKNKNQSSLILFVTLLLIVFSSVVVYFYSQHNKINKTENKGDINIKNSQSIVEKNPAGNINKPLHVRKDQENLKTESIIHKDELVLNWSDVIHKDLAIYEDLKSKVTKQNITFSFIAPGKPLSEDAKAPTDIKKKHQDVKPKRLIKNKSNVLPSVISKYDTEK
ncbi:MAG: ATP-binding protein [Psychromonas sp.]|nr:ATP-binding protein [Psychromonas sp.]